jgi:hypothetical protein
MAEIDGAVGYGEIVKGSRKILVRTDDGEEREYSIPKGLHVTVQEGERVRAGDAFTDGPKDPHKILEILGERELQQYLLDGIQEVYRLQGVHIHDKHIEVIIRQMMRWIKVEDPGDTEFIVDEQVDRFRFVQENERVLDEGGVPARGRPLLLGITKASLATESFISAASFQETTRVLTEASISGKVDFLRGLKENVIMGRLAFRVRSRGGDRGRGRSGYGSLRRDDSGRSGGCRPRAGWEIEMRGPAAALDRCRTALLDSRSFAPVLGYFDYSACDGTGRGVFRPGVIQRADH